MAACAPAPTDFEQASAAYQAKRYDEALPLMIKAAHAGNTNAMALAGSMLVMGQGGSADVVEGVRWLRQAAEAGNATAQMMLGTVFAYGTGVKQDSNQARHWLDLAVKQGDAQALVILNKINGKTAQTM